MDEKHHWFYHHSNYKRKVPSEQNFSIHLTAKRSREVLTRHSQLPFKSRNRSIIQIFSILVRKPTTWCIFPTNQNIFGKCSAALNYWTLRKLESRFLTVFVGLMNHIGIKSASQVFNFATSYMYVDRQLTRYSIAQKIQ